MYQRIKDLREDADKLQKEVAFDLNTNATQYRRYESGEREPPFEFIIKIANYYKVSIDYIAGITNEKKGLCKSDLPAKDNDILSNIHLLNDERKGILIGYLNRLVEEQEQEKQHRKGVV